MNGSDNSSPRTKHEPSWFEVTREAVASTKTRGSARAALLAAAFFANQRGELWPSLARWAQIAGMSVRTLQRAIDKLLAKGVLRTEAQSVGGPGKTTVYIVPALVRNPVRLSPLAPRQPDPPTPSKTACNPVRHDAQPRQPDGGTTRNGKEPSTTSARAVVDALGLGDLLNHPNATPERLAYIEKSLSDPNRKRKIIDPAAFAASAIREGYRVPLPDPKEAGARARKELRARFAAMPPAERGRLFARARVRCPGIADPVQYPDDCREVLNAVVLVMDEDARDKFDRE